MDMIRAIVVDNEYYALQEISELIKKTGFIKVEKTYENPLEALKEVETLLPQIAFLDIEMPEMDGILLAEKLLEKKPDIYVVFVTAYNKYAVQAFEINALDYVLKPIDYERFKKTLERIKKSFNHEPVLEKQLTIQIKCFNQLEVLKNGIPVKWGRSKAEELFAYLLMNHGIRVHKEAIIEDLWPDYPPQKSLTYSPYFHIQN